MEILRPTSMGGDQIGFPSTRWSTLLAAADRRSPTYRAALEEFCRQYWKPVYIFIRSARTLGNDEAKDLTQGFFLDLVDGELLEQFNPQRGTFRSYLKAAVRYFLIEEGRRTGAQKRGGGRRILHFGEDHDRILEQMVPSSEADPDSAFDREWSNSIIDLAVADLEEELRKAGKEVHFRIFERHELRPPAEGSPSHEELAREFGMKATDVNHVLARCRQAFREKIVGRLREYVTSASELEEEIRELFQD